MSEGYKDAYGMLWCANELALNGKFREALVLLARIQRDFFTPEADPDFLELIGAKRLVYDDYVNYLMDRYPEMKGEIMEKNDVNFEKKVGKPGVGDDAKNDRSIILNLIQSGRNKFSMSTSLVRSEAGNSEVKIPGTVDYEICGITSFEDTGINMIFVIVNDMWPVESYIHAQSLADPMVSDIRDHVPQLSHKFCILVDQNSLDNVNMAKYESERPNLIAWWYDCPYNSPLERALDLSAVADDLILKRKYPKAIELLKKALNTMDPDNVDPKLEKLLNAKILVYEDFLKFLWVKYGDMVT